MRIHENDNSYRMNVSDAAHMALRMRWQAEKSAAICDCDPEDVDNLMETTRRFIYVPTPTEIEYACRLFREYNGHVPEEE